MIVIDPRIGSGELLPYFKPYDVPVRAEYLDFGDAAWWGQGAEGPVLIGVERKGIHDLVQSMRSKRLSGHQLPGLLKSYQFVYLLVEGIWQAGRGGEVETPYHNTWRPLLIGSRPIMYREVDHYLATLEHMTGLVVKQTSSKTQTVAYLVSRYKWWDKPWHQHDGHDQIYAPCVESKRGGRMVLRTPGLVEKMASQITGVDKAAYGVARKFKSVVKMVNGSVDDWSAVEVEVKKAGGVGRMRLGAKKAQRIWDELRKEG